MSWFPFDVLHWGTVAAGQSSMDGSCAEWVALDRVLKRKAGPLVLAWGNALVMQLESTWWCLGTHAGSENF